jgi:hypothetical protein
VSVSWLVDSKCMCSRGPDADSEDEHDEDFCFDESDPLLPGSGRVTPLSGRATPVNGRQTPRGGRRTPGLGGLHARPRTPITPGYLGRKTPVFKDDDMLTSYPPQQ